MSFFAPLLSAASKYFATKTGAAVATAAVSAAGSTIVGAAQNRAAQASYNTMLDKQAAARRRQTQIDEKNRQLAKEDAANRFTDMSAAARKAGINPLTALRATGGVGFGAYGGYSGLQQATINAPIMSKQNFAATFGINLAGTLIQNKINEPIDKYNEQVRKLELEQRGLDIKISKKTLNNIGNPTLEPKTVPLVDGNGQIMTDRDGTPIFVPAETNEVIPKFKLVYDQSSRETYAIINPELTESGLSETLTGLSMDAAAKTAHKLGTDFSYQGYGFPADPYGLNRGILSRSGDNRSLGWPQSTK